MLELDVRGLNLNRDDDWRNRNNRYLIRSLSLVTTDIAHELRFKLEQFILEANQEPIDLVFDESI